MNLETRRKIEQTVTDIMQKTSLEGMTEFKVRTRAQERLGIDLSSTQCKSLVREVLESCLVSSPEDPDGGKEQEPRPTARYETRAAAREIVPKQEVNDSGDRIICKLSNNRNVAVQDFKGQTLVSIRQYFEKEGKQHPSTTGISLTTQQWSVLKESVPAIEEAILGLQRKERSEHLAEKIDAVSDPMTGVTPKLPSRTIRFVGKNYHVWASQMEFLLQHFKIAYVLSDQHPNAMLGPESSLGSAARTKAGEQKWKSDDDICRRMILNSLSDSLFYHYTKKSMSARELWKELKMIYVIEDSGTKRSKVKKYLEFKMVEERSILKQVEELGNVAISIVKEGIQIDDDFHVSAVISKLPPSWKDVCVKLMHEDHLSLVELKDRLRMEEHLRTQQNSHLSRRGSQHPAWNHMSSSRGSQHPASNHMSSSRGSQQPALNNVSMTEVPNSQSLPLRKREWQMEVQTLLCLNCGKEGHVCPNCPKAKQ